ncbi:MAG: adenine-specific methyltransferase EcoRI family protein [Rickettsiales bacterium]|nr:adenine-specific methyltransferase EcoRI family protein [Rickettsiales bacterium]
MANENKRLQKARAAKNDEFYTQLSDIEQECNHYKKYFKGKTIFCNCDDPKVSNFFKYFANNFEKLGLKKLITTCYKNTNPDLFTRYESEKGIAIEYEGDKNNNRVPDPNEIEVVQLEGDGDFRSPECIELLKQADIVCTNPPFSLFREFVDQLMKYKKKFIIIGNKNSVTYKEVFRHIMNNEMWLGYRNINSDMWFILPDEAEKWEKIEDGKKLKHIMGCWFTNLEVTKRKQELPLYKKYKSNESEFPKYDNFDAINVDKVSDIPMDYKGIMGVPITFIDKYNPEQFKIIGSMASTTIDDISKGYPFINNERKYARILIKQKNKKS